MFADVAGVLFFRATDGTHGKELWKSDGTDAGTVLVKDIRPRERGSRRRFTDRSLIESGGTVYFAADDGTHGLELWKSDGTEARTVMVVDLHLGTEGSSPQFITDVTGAPFFSAKTPGTGRELWSITPE